MESSNLIEIVAGIISQDQELLTPKVRPEAEFREISSNFGDPLEVVREAVSNAYDALASEMHITFRVEQRGGFDTLIIELRDNGKGMTRDELANNFWDLGNSTSSGDPSKIGEKGHGTKIYLRSERVIVITHSDSGSFYSYCDNPFLDLSEGRVHKPKLSAISNIAGDRGTTIILEKYNNNEMSRYRQEIVKDYLYWFTKLGSFEREFSGKNPREIVVYLRCLDWREQESELLPFGHRFAKVNDDLV